MTDAKKLIEEKLHETTRLTSRDLHKAALDTAKQLQYLAKQFGYFARSLKQDAHNIDGVYSVNTFDGEHYLKSLGAAIDEAGEESDELMDLLQVCVTALNNLNDSYRD